MRFLKVKYHGVNKAGYENQKEYFICVVIHPWLIGFFFNKLTIYRARSTSATIGIQHYGDWEEFFYDFDVL